MSLESSLFVAVVVVVVGWFAVGTQINVRKGHRLLAWLQSGLPLIGERTTLRWLGSSAVELRIASAHAPFRRAEVVVVLEPRDVPPVWLWSRLQRRRDLIIFRGELQQRPRLRLELLSREAWPLLSGERDALRCGWPPLALDAAGFRAWAPQPVPQLPRLLALAELPGLPLLRLAVREENHRIELNWRLVQPGAGDAQKLFAAVYAVVQQIG
jgi:hypothetical protein